MEKCNNYIDGKFTQGSAGSFAVTSPWSGLVIANCSGSNASDVNSAVSSAKKAFSEWSLKTYKDRAQYLFRFRELVLKHLDELSAVVSLESGKTEGEAKAGVLKGVEVVEFALSLQNKVHTGGSLEVSKGVHCEQIRVPMGVCLGITPFNFPAMVPMWLFPISIACGNTFIWKPSEKVPMTAQVIAKLMHEAGFPAGVFQVVNGDAGTVDLLIESEDVKVVSFVGSSQVAKLVYDKSTSLGKRSLCLGGAKNFIVLCDDAEPESTASSIVDSFTGCAGQRCMAASLLLVVGKDPALDNILKNVVEKASSMTLGQSMGAIISSESLERIHKIIEKSKTQGAKITLDGRGTKVEGKYAKGYWLGPTIIDHASNDMICFQDEIFGPVLTICRVDTLEQALELERKHRYGNATSVFTSSGAHAAYVAAQSSSGMIGVNIGVPVPREPFSFGGRKDSKFGQGDITGDSSLELWTDLKKITTKWSSIKKNDWMS